MKKYNLTNLLILLIGILTLFSCSSGENSTNTTKYDYCVYMEKEICLSGSYENCPNGGTPSNTCPNGYNKGESNSSSSENVIGNSSSSNSSSSVNSNNNNSSSSKNIVSSSSSFYSSSSINSNNNSSSSVGGGYTGEYGSVEHCGQKYKTVVIGTQTWFAENVNCPTDLGSKCYGDDPTNCSKYGRLYEWETAMTVCPTGWHLPDKTEWETLINFAGGEDIAGKKLKSTSGWSDNWNDNGNGTDELGFSALPSGYGYGRSLGGNFNFEGIGSFLWSSSEFNNYYAYFWRMKYNNDVAFCSYTDLDKSYFISVRCIKN